MTRNRDPFIIVTSGPSGVGKSTVAAGVLDALPGLARSISYTTREIREGEENGVDYHFVSREDFMGIRDGGGMLESARVHGNYYGTSTEQVDGHLSAGKDVLLEIDVQGGEQVLEKRPGTLRIFLMPPSMAELERRLRDRDTDTGEVIEKRLAKAKKEIQMGGRYRHHVVNDDLDRCVAEIADIIARARD